jgi:transcription antitermination factor NusG
MAPEIANAGTDWSVLRTWTKHESVVEKVLTARKIECYLPKQTQVRQWSDRKKTLVLPLFPGYLFIKVRPEQFQDLRDVPGSCGLVWASNRPAPIRESVVLDIRRLVEAQAQLTIMGGLHVGERVRILSGALKGIEGVLARAKNKDYLVINAEAIGQSICIEVPVSLVGKLRP